MTDRLESRKVIRDGLHAKEALEVLRAKGIPPASLVSIAEKAAHILERSVDPNVGPSEQPTAGPLHRWPLIRAHPERENEHYPGDSRDGGG